MFIPPQTTNKFVFSYDILQDATHNLKTSRNTRAEHHQAAAADGHDPSTTRMENTVEASNVYIYMQR
jgi:hypothetical protein